MSHHLFAVPRLRMQHLPTSSQNSNSLAAYHDSPPCLSQGQATAKVMSPAEMAEYEEKKLKMRKAMGENLHDDVQGRQCHALRCLTSAVHVHAPVAPTLYTDACSKHVCVLKGVFCVNGKQVANKVVVNHLQVAYSLHSWLLLPCLD